MAKISANTGAKGHSPANDSTPRPHTAAKGAVTMNLSPQGFAIAVLIASSVSYLAGEVFRIQMPHHPLASLADSLVRPIPRGGRGKRPGREKRKLPSPKLQRGKVMPETRYTSNVYLDGVDGGRGPGSSAVRSSFDLHIQPWPEGEECGTDGDEGAAAARECEAGCRAAAGSGNEASEEGHAGGDDEEYLPAGQHLLVDIKNVEGAFLNSEQRLAEAMVEVVNQSHLTLLSYHCHSLAPAGVSCVGILLESHISFHTWPAEGVITLDLFTCGSNPLVPVLPIIEGLFAVPQAQAGTYQPLDGKNDTYVPREEDYVDPPKMIWSHVLRGFRLPVEGGGWRVLESDVADVVLKRLELDLKREVVSVESQYQHISIFDILDPKFSTIQSYERSLRSHIDTYEVRHPELFRPNRMVFMDGVIQSTSRGDAPYHEALVHPGMFAHPDPRRVAIIGGGEGATLREVLKHSTVQKATMIEIDEAMVNVSRQYLKDWNDCSDLAGPSEATECCFDDPRAELLCEDALAWFVDRFRYPCDCGGGQMSEDEMEYCECGVGDSSDNHDEANAKHLGTVEKFDVIIMDALPQDTTEFADVLYNNEVFLESLYGALTEDGVLVMQLGHSPRLKDPNGNGDMVMAMIEDMGFQSMHVYQERHTDFYTREGWSFLVACKHFDCRYNWFANEATREVDIHNRIVRTNTGGSPLRYYDGATARSYQVPPKAWEVVFCRRDPQPVECSKFRGYDKAVANFPVESFEVQNSTVGDSAGLGTFAKVDIPMGSYLAQEEASKKVHFHPQTTEVMEEYHGKMEEAEGLRDVLRYMYGYGFQQYTLADHEYYVDSSIMTFINHGCNGTNNIALAYQNADAHNPFFNEALIDPAKRVSLNPTNVTFTFNPVLDRHLPNVAAGYEVALRDIKAGEELFQNYLSFISDEEEWAEEVRDLQAQCRGETVVMVKEDELSSLDEEEEEE